MMEVSSEDASRKFKKVPIGAAQAKWESLQPNNRESSGNGGGKRKASDAGMAGSPITAEAESNSRQEPIEIDSSSESEGVEGGGATIGQVPDADKPLPSTEDTESEENGESRSLSSGGGRGGFMAKRGGRRA
jgi:hypothetical protein